MSEYLDFNHPPPPAGGDHNFPQAYHARTESCGTPPSMRFVPQQGGGGMDVPAGGGPQFQGGGGGGDEGTNYTTREPLPTRSQNRNLHPGEMDDHTRPGGETNSGVRPRRADGPDMHENERRAGNRRKHDENNQPWHPETIVFEAERTRRR
jgi:hypothetical protein